VDTEGVIAPTTATRGERERAYPWVSSGILVERERGRERERERESQSCGFTE
jgi:hypothetical protein